MTGKLIFIQPFIYSFFNVRDSSLYVDVLMRGSKRFKIYWLSGYFEISKREDQSGVKQFPFANNCE